MGRKGDGVDFRPTQNKPLAKAMFIRVWDGSRLRPPYVPRPNLGRKSTPSPFVPGPSNPRGGTKPPSGLLLAEEDHPAGPVHTDLLASDVRPTGLISHNDRLSFGAYQAFAEHGLRVPDDLSIASFDDDVTASYLRPG